MDKFLVAWGSYAFASSMGSIIACIYTVYVKDGTIAMLGGRVSKDSSLSLFFVAVALNVVLIWCLVFILAEPSADRQAMFLSMGAVAIFGGNKADNLQSRFEKDLS